MGIIDIDDRDVINNFYSVADPTKQNLWLNRLKAENNSARIINIGEEHYKIDLPVITCTGADVISYFQIPGMHALRKMEVKHTDAVNADSSNSLAYSLEHRHNPGLWLKIIDIDASTASDIYDEYTNFYIESGQYRIISNSTNADRIYIAITIKITGM